MKRLLALLMASIMVLALASCGGERTPPAEGEGEEGGTPSTSGTAEFKLVIGSTVQDDSASGIALLEYFKPYIEEQSGGRIQVDVQNNSVLGGDRELFEGLQLNTVQASFGPLSTLANFEPDFAVCDLPFLFADKETAYASLDGEFGDALAENLPQRGMRLLAYGENAFRNISNSKKPIETMEDLAGMKIRVMESPVNLATYKALGANPTPMSFSELYTGLQQNTVDGQDNGVVLTYTAKFYEVQKYYTFSGQIYAANAVVVSEAFWQTLPEDLQQIVADGALYAMENQRRLNSEMEESLLGEMEAAGVEVTYMEEAEIDRMRQATKTVWDEFSSTISTEIFDMAVAIRDGE